MDDATTNKVLTAFVALLTALGGWLLRTVLGNDRKLTALAQRTKATEARVEHLEGKPALTEEAVRKVFKQEFSEREEVAEKLRHERERRLAVEVRQAVNEEIRGAIPHIVREIKGDSSVFPRPKHFPT